MMKNVIKDGITTLMKKNLKNGGSYFPHPN